MNKLGLSVPPGPAAVLSSLRFDRRGPIELTQLSEEDWKEALDYSDRNYLTLLWFSAVEQAELPEWVRERFEGNARSNQLRLEKLLSIYQSLTKRFEQAGVEHLVLKGLAQWPAFTADLARRTQYDLDIYCPKESLHKGFEVATQMGYEPVHEMKAFPTDHLPVMIQKTGWEWKGDYFDVELPISIDLHFRFWDRKTECFGPNDLDGFWERRIVRDVPGAMIHSLCENDSLAYACLHALRHLLRGDSKPNHIYEIAWFLQRHQDEQFWNRWKACQDPSMLRIQAVCFLLARMWFGCDVPPDAEAAIRQLPPSVHSWAQRWGLSALEAAFRPNKDELWLHLCLVESGKDKLAVLRNRLLPIRVPGPVGAVHIPASRLTPAQKLIQSWLYTKFVFKRFAHHLALLVPTVGHGLHWWMSKKKNVH